MTPEEGLKAFGDLEVQLKQALATLTGIRDIGDLPIEMRERYNNMGRSVQFAHREAGLAVAWFQGALQRLKSL